MKVTIRGHSNVSSIGFTSVSFYARYFSVTFLSLIFKMLKRSFSSSFRLTYMSANFKKQLASNAKKGNLCSGNIQEVSGCILLNLNLFSS